MHPKMRLLRRFQRLMVEALPTIMVRLIFKLLDHSW